MHFTSPTPSFAAFVAWYGHEDIYYRRMTGSLVEFRNPFLLSQYWGVQRRDPSGWLRLLSLVLAANLYAGSRTFKEIEDETAALTAERDRLRSQADALDREMVGTFRGITKAVADAGLKGSTLER